ncbi:MAG: hypothetical protein QXI19_09145 [Candidatus Caldarchaeum sp.]
MSTIEPDQGRRGERSPYITKREIVYAFVILIVALVIYYFIFYVPWKNSRDYVVSQGNLRRLHQAIITYSEQNDEGLPAVFAVGTGGRVSLDRFGRPITWANLTGANHLEPELLKNPKSRSEWDTLITGGKNPYSAMHLSYGMLAPLGLQRRYTVTEPNIVILLAETIGGGRANSLDPLPLDVPDKRDGFIIGYNDSNTSPTQGSQYVTRLAFIADSPDTPLQERLPVHPGRSVLAITVSGTLVHLSASDMLLEKVGNAPAGKWAPFR